MSKKDAFEGRIFLIQRCSCLSSFNHGPFLWLPMLECVLEIFLRRSKKKSWRFFEKLKLNKFEFCCALELIFGPRPSLNLKFRCRWFKGWGAERKRNGHLADALLRHAGKYASATSECSLKTVSSGGYWRWKSTRIKDLSQRFSWSVEWPRWRQQVKGHFLWLWSIFVKPVFFLLVSKVQLFLCAVFSGRTRKNVWRQIMVGWCFSLAPLMQNSRFHHPEWFFGWFKVKKLACFKLCGWISFKSKTVYHLNSQFTIS